jgi:hypothetical protein
MNDITQHNEGGPLSTNEQQQLSELESIIETGLQTFIQVGAALATIRDSRLYRAEYPTFESYCDERWGLARRRAYQLMDAATAAQNVQNFTQTAPAIESHAAALAALPSPDLQREAWQEATRRAQEAGTRLTAALVKTVVSGMLPSQSSQVASNGTAQPEQPPAALDNDELDSLLSELSPSQADIDSPDDILTELADETADEPQRREPPAPGYMRVRVVTGSYEDAQQAKDVLLQALGSGKYTEPKEASQPKYADSYRVYSREDVQIARNAAPVEEDERGRADKLQAELRQARKEIDNLQRANEAEMQQAQQEIARLQDELQEARGLAGQARAILEEYRLPVSKAQQYKPSSTRGEAVSPLLRCIERVWLLLQEK